MFDIGSGDPEHCKSVESIRKYGRDFYRIYSRGGSDGAADCVRVLNGSVIAPYQPGDKPQLTLYAFTMTDFARILSTFSSHSVQDHTGVVFSVQRLSMNAQYLGAAPAIVSLCFSQ